MLRRLFRAILPTLLLLEAAFSGMWIWGLLPGIAARDMTTLVLVSTRAAVSVFQMISFWCLRTDRPFAAILSQRTLLAAGILMTLEVGFRLAPTNLDPSFRWHVVIAYWAYVALAVLTLRPKLTR
jgi:hypothetical protein